MSVPLAHIAHRTEGRTRFKIPSRRGDPGYLAELLRRLSDCPEVVELRCNAASGSVVVVHRAGFDAVRRFAEDTGLFVVGASAAVAAPTTTVPLSQQIREQLQRFDQGVTSLSGGLDVPSLGFMLLFGLGVAQLLRGYVVGSAVQLFWYALGALWMSRQNPPP